MGRTVPTSLFRALAVRFSTTPLKGCRGWGIADCIRRCDRQALVVYAVYKSKMTCQFDAGTECEVGPRGLNATRVSSAVKELF